jgi:hypothetical protein
LVETRYFLKSILPIAVAEGCLSKPVDWNPKMLFHILRLGFSATVQAGILRISHP